MSVLYSSLVVVKWVVFGSLMILCPWLRAFWIINLMGMIILNKQTNTSPMRYWYPRVAFTALVVVLLHDWRGVVALWPVYIMYIALTAWVSTVIAKAMIKYVPEA